MIGKRLVDPTAPGAPLIPDDPLSPVIHSAYGDFAAGNGFQILLEANALTFLCRVDGNEISAGIDLMHLLHAISEYTRAHES